MRYLSTYKIFENKEVDFIRQLFVDIIEELESDGISTKIRPYDTHLHSPFMEMPDVVIEIMSDNRSNMQPSGFNKTNMFSYTLDLYNSIKSKLDYLENQGDVTLIGVDYEYNRTSGGYGRYISKFNNLLDLKQFDHYIDCPDTEFLFRLRLYFRFEIKE